MDYSEKWGSSVDEAVSLALDELGLTINDVEVTILEEPSRGFLGLGSKLAKVRVEKKKVEEKPEVKETPIKKEEKTQVKKEKKPNKEKSLEEEVPVEPVIEENLTEVTDHVALNFLKEIARDMGIEVEVTCKVSTDSVYLDINGKDSATVIGKRGQTLDSLQYLTSLVVNKGEGPYTRVVVDAEGYRAKREKTLKNLAMRLASKVQKSHRSVKLEPMNPYERKVIHATLQNHPYVTTKSEGEEPYRRVIIELKK